MAAARQAAGRNAIAGRPRDRGFWLCLACATALHVALLIGAIGTAPRRMGEPDGSLDGISVDVVDAADLAAPGPPALGADQPVPPPADSTPADAAPSESTPPIEPPAREEAAAALRKSDGDSSSRKMEIDLDRAGLLAVPDPAAAGKGERAGKDGRSRPAPQASPQAGLDLSLPRNLPEPSISFRGGSAGVSRPADITRSGENDGFGRGVVRALRQTMPAPDGFKGTVTIRFLLTEAGNIAELVLVAGSGNAVMDRNVMFAARQASFPIPPRRSTRSDRTFLVTYLYR